MAKLKKEKISATEIKYLKKHIAQNGYCSWDIYLQSS